MARKQPAASSSGAPRGAKASGGALLGRRIMQRIGELAQCSDEAGRVTRIYLSPSHREAAKLVERWMGEAGMSTRIDALGTVVGTYDGAAVDSRVLLIGSHIDSVPDAGRFDGTLGVVTGIEVVAALHRAGRRLPFAIGIAAFGDEEGRFPSTLGGSRLLAGSFDPKILDETDARGTSRRDALTAFGCDPGRIRKDLGDPRRLLGYVEVHIEQGPVLEAEGLPAGVVTAINGATRGHVEVRGVSGHAGTVPMTLRQDALCAAAEMALAIERRALDEPDLVATVGRLEIPGGAVNTVPGLARFTIDLRSPSDERRQRAIADLRREFAAISVRRRVEISIKLGYDAAATPCDARLSDVMGRCVEARGISLRKLPSGAGHDAMSFRGKCPVAMLFVRCRGGISHNPAEHAATKDIDVAARTLADFIERLAVEP